MKTSEELFKELMKLPLDERHKFKEKLNSDPGFYVSTMIPMIPIDAVGLPLHMGYHGLSESISNHAKYISGITENNEVLDKIQRESVYGLWAKATIEDSAFLKSIYLVGVLSNEDLEEWEFYELPEDHPDRNFVFNRRREHFELPLIELKVGNTYILKLGKDRVIFKKMELVNIIGNEQFPDLYFRDLEIDHNKGIINIGYHKIWCQIKRVENGN